MAVISVVCSVILVVAASSDQSVSLRGNFPRASMETVPPKAIDAVSHREVDKYRYILLSPDTSVCPSNSSVILDGSACRRAAISLGYSFGREGSDGGAPPGCFGLYDGEAVREISFNTIFQMTWSDVGVVCFRNGTFSLTPPGTNACSELTSRVATKSDCLDAAKTLEYDFGRAGTDGGAPPGGCYVVFAEDGKVAEISFNTIGTAEASWSDIGVLCASQPPQDVIGESLYTLLPADTSRCPTASVGILNSSACRDAAIYLGYSFGFEGVDSGAPQGCFGLYDDDGEGVFEISFNTIFQTTWADLGVVCVRNGTFSLTAPNTNACSELLSRVATQSDCLDAAKSFECEFGGVVSDGGAPPGGCYVQYDDDGSAVEIIFNTRGTSEQTWHDIGVVCAKAA